MKYDDALEWMWWAGAGHGGPLTRYSVGGAFAWKGHRGTVRDVAHNAVLVEWDGAAPADGPVERPDGGKQT